MATDRQARTIQGVTHGTAVVRLSHTDCTTAGVAQTITLATLRAAHPNGAAGLVPAKARITKMWINLIELFAGGSVATCVLNVGEVSGDVDELMAAEDIFTGATLGIVIGAGAFTLGTYGAAYLGQCTVTTTTDNVDALTTGEAEICIQYESHTTDALT